VSRRWLTRSAPALRYGLAVLVTAGATAAAVALRPLVESRPAPPFLLAVLVVAWVQLRSRDGDLRA
jgi:hypothetical protein